MKLNRHLVILAVLLTGCEKASVTEAPKPTSLPVSVTRSSETDPYFVSEEDMSGYLHFKKLLSKDENFEVKDIMPLGIDDSSVQAYVVNYLDGWELVSADKRTEAVIAYGEKGTFVKGEGGAVRQAYIESLLHHLALLQKCPETSPDIADEVEANLMFWKLVTCDIDDVNTRLALPNGYYSLEHVDTIVNVVNTVPHMIQTHWTYENNIFIPYDFQHMCRPDAGTGNVAAAQMLVFLATQRNFLLTPPSSSNFAGNTDWAGVAAGNGDAFVYDVYNHSYSRTISQQLPTYTHPLDLSMAISSYGAANTLTSANHVTFAHYENIINQNLEAGMPLIACSNASVCLMNDEGLYYSEESPYYFIIDAYREYQEQYYFTYVWIYNDGTEGDSYITSRYSPAITRKYGMNWCSSADFVLNGEWFMLGSYFYRYHGLDVYNDTRDTRIFHGFASHASDNE